MKGIYLFSGFAYHLDYDLDYCDLDTKSTANIKTAAQNVNINKYDFILASPPCNFWSRALGNRNPSKYALETKDLLLWSINELPKYNKPLIIENVRNYKKFDKYGVLAAANKNGLYIHFIGRHTYFKNVFINLSCKQEYDFKYGGKRLIPYQQSIGGKNVFECFEIFLNNVTKEKRYSDELELQKITYD